MTIVEGIDLDLLLEDLAYTKQRLSKLEDDQETIVKFLRARFPKMANQLKRLLREHEDSKKPSKVTTTFMQEDEGLTTYKAIAQCISARPVSVDPVLSKVCIQSSQKMPEALKMSRG
ncbi:hypothetical protein [Methanosarcina sp.]|uniref:hypothetical protein n=1 Tax=Methanosarcina sp. TaxID=2213 RepID=UPI003BB6112B